MNRWGRILFNTLTAISLLLAIATGALWVRGIWVVDALYQESPTLGRILRVSVGAGHVGVMWPDGWDGLTEKWAYTAMDAPRLRSGWMGPFTIGQRTFPDGTRWGFAAMPMWTIQLGTLILPAYFGLGQWQRIRRVQTPFVSQL